MSKIEIKSKKIVAPRYKNKKIGAPWTLEPTAHAKQATCVNESLKVHQPANLCVRFVSKRLVTYM